MPRFPRVAAAFGAVAVCALFLPLTAGSAAYARVDDQRTRSYDVRGALDDRGQLKITETIAFDFGTTPHHGITREIPTEPATSDGVFVEKGVWARSPDGASAAANVERTDSRTTIRLGDPDATVTGEHTYELHYVLGGVVEEGSAKFVSVDWDAIGTEWETSIDAASVRLTAPAKAHRPHCYAGEEGGHHACTGFSARGKTLSEPAKRLPYGEGITIKAGYPESKVSADSLMVERADVAALETSASPTPSEAGSDQHSGSGDGATALLFIVLIPLIIIGVIARLVRGGGGGWGGGYRRGYYGAFGGGFGSDSSGGSFDGGGGGGDFGGGGDGGGGGGGDFGGGGDGGGVGGGDGGGGGGSW